MTRGTQAKLRLIGSVIGALASQSAVAGGPKSAAPAAPHVSAPAPHAAMPAPRPLGGGMVAPHAPMMGAAHAPMAAPRPAMGANHFAAPAQRPAAPAAAMQHAGHFASPAAGHVAAPAAGHFAGAPAHAGPAGLHAYDRRGERGEIGRGEMDRGNERQAGRGDLARDDPARAHGRFDEHVRNPERERDIVRLHEHDFHVHDVRYFNDREWARWRGGYWQRDYYDGRFGWWFDVGGVYYPYAAPIWPYPLTVAPLVAADAVDTPPPAMPIPPLPALPHVAYHCTSPTGFYPAVDACNAGWVTLAAH